MISPTLRFLLLLLLLFHLIQLVQPRRQGVGKGVRACLPMRNKHLQTQSGRFNASKCKRNRRHIAQRKGRQSRSHKGTKNKRFCNRQLKQKSKKRKRHNFKRRRSRKLNQNNNRKRRRSPQLKQKNSKRNRVKRRIGSRSKKELKRKGNGKCSKKYTKDKKR